jgi:four helix bundle protein
MPFALKNGSSIGRRSTWPRAAVSSRTAFLAAVFPNRSAHRAALFIATNAEGNGRFAKSDRRNFSTIARGSVQECVPLLEVSRRRVLLDESKHAALRQELEVIAKMVSGLINGLENRDA